MDTFEQSFSVSDKIRYFIISGAGAALVGWLFYKNIAASLIMLALPFVFYKKYKAYVIDIRKDRVNARFKDVLYAFSDAAASGKQADTAVYTAYRNLKSIYGEEDILTKEFEYMSARIRETRDSPVKLLTEFSRRMGIEDIRSFVEIYCICIRSGGDREKAINKTVEIIRERIMLRQELSSALIQKKIEACILCSIPLAVLGFMQIFSGDYSEVLYSTAQGRIIMTGCLAAALWAGALSLKIMDIKV